MKSKVGFHIDIRAFPQEIDKIIYAGTRIIKVIQSLDLLQQVHAVLGDKTTYIARHWAVGDSFQAFGVGLSAKAKAKAWYDAMLPYIQQVPYAFFEAFNEPDTSPNVLSAYNDFEVERQHIMHDNGYKCAIGSFATGQPELSVWPLFYPALSVAHRYKNILGLHEYSALYMDTYYGGNSADAIRTGQRQPMPANYAEGWLTFRYRKVWDQHIKSHGWTDLKIALTEYGLMSYSPPEINAITGYPVGPWRTCGRAWSDLNGRSDTENYYSEQLQWCDRQMQADHYVLGATVFTWGQYGWPDDEIEGQVANNLVNYIHSTVDDPEPPEVDTMRAKGLDVSHYQGEFNWETAKTQDDIDFAIPRYAYGLAVDETFAGNFARAKAAGLPVGTYYFPNCDKNIDDQVTLYVNSPWSQFELPMGIDVERNPFSTVQINEGMCRRFVEEVARITGRLPAIYTSKTAWEFYIGKGKTWASKYPLWIAHYTTDLYPDIPVEWSNWTIWQNKVGPINSYTSNIDQNVFNGSIADLKCRFNVPTSEVFKLRRPVNSTRITQAFGADPAHYGPLLGASGMGHEGTDHAAGKDDPIYACADGVVSERYYDQDYGNLIVLDHQNGFRTLYGHMNRLSASAVGTRVKAGDRIGDAGTTGASTGTHLHLTLYYDRGDAVSVYPKKTRGYIINPTPYLQAPAQASVQMRMAYTQDINLRAEPSVGSLDIGDVAVGEVVTAYPPAVNEYLKVVAHGITGYALVQHFEVVTNVAVRLRSTASPYVNIRSGPSTAFSAVGRLYLGEEINGYPVAGDAFWKVIFNGADAWISASYLEAV